MPKEGRLTIISWRRCGAMEVMSYICPKINDMKRYLLLLTAIVLGCLAATAQNLDIDILHDVNSWKGSFIHDYSDFISSTEPYVALGIPATMAVVGAIKKDKGLMKDALYIGVSVAGSFAFAYGLKYIVNRDRPYVTYPDRVHPHSYEDSPSFPSGHTASAFALATSLCIRYPKWYVIAPSALYACSVGVSRMYEGVHYPSDVLAGAAIGAGCAVASVYVNRWLNKVLFGD